MAKNLIEFRLKKNGKAALNLNGDIYDLTAGVLVMVKGIHQTILLNHSEADAKSFMEQLGMALTNPEHPLYKEVRE